MTYRFETVVLHIGLGKTGTSAIQQTLERRAGELEQACNTLFPLIEDDPRRFAGNHSMLLRSVCSEQPETLRFNIAAGLASREAATAADQRVMQSWEHRFEVTKADTLLLSAEGVGHFDDAAVTRLGQWLAPLARRIRVLAWVRHPQHSLSAEIQQRLKTGARLERLYQRPPFYRYSAIFSRLERVFGKAAIELYDYADSLAPGSSAVATFFDKAGLPLAPGSQDAERVNVALSQKATLLLDAVNRLRPLVIDGARNPGRKPHDLVRILKVPGDPYAPPPDVYAALAEQAAPELAWLQAQYGFSPRPVPPRHAPCEQPPVDQAAIDAEALSLLDAPG